MVSMVSIVLLISILAPMPPQVAVNPQTRQCGSMMAGDEHVYYRLSDPWQVVDANAPYKTDSGVYTWDGTSAGVRVFCEQIGYTYEAGNLAVVYGKKAGSSFSILTILAVILVLLLIAFGILYILSRLAEKIFRSTKKSKPSAPSEPRLSEADCQRILAPYADQIQATVQPFIDITAHRQNNLPPWQSHFGGTPYLPLGFPHPLDSRGKPMYLLAQINFSEIPRLPGFPQAGILQFFIAGNHDVYGINFDSPADQVNFRVIYHPEIIEDSTRLVTDFSYLPAAEYLPVHHCSALEFSLGSAPIPVEDIHFFPRILNIPASESASHFDEIRDVLDAYETIHPTCGHKLGGYPYFTQNDPRGGKGYPDSELVLLFQMDTDDKAGVMFGDAGLANFFISPADLANLDFARVYYNWDCC
jgi:uncharacterized protein YwqG